MCRGGRGRRAFRVAIVCAPLFLPSFSFSFLTFFDEIVLRPGLLTTPILPPYVGKPSEKAMKMTGSLDNLCGVYSFRIEQPAPPSPPPPPPPPPPQTPRKIWKRTCYDKPSPHLADVFRKDQSNGAKQCISHEAREPHYRNAEVRTEDYGWQCPHVVCCELDRGV